MGPGSTSHLRSASRICRKSFVRVAYIHNASYLGGLLGLVVATHPSPEAQEAACCGCREQCERVSVPSSISHRSRCAPLMLHAPRIKPMNR